ncbi:MerR family transcriptional regulator [Cesiribacter andamanensis]|uniref:HTH-type transcriptional repressor YcgE n=1 Tax=Cesiribacter andamanensis AMV16 TaxID=1279009 RepID=M7N3D5_9BACT|nr:HTH-type transcriptional repressor YcgE [Cesiribacter andamanensis AMV16]
MSHYSIKDLEHLSGIKAHTLRIWEQRYNFLHPDRTDTNIRLYNDDDLKLILNVSLLRDNGFKISKIAGMDARQIGEAVRQITDQQGTHHTEQIHALSLAMIDLDEERFEKIMSTNILQQGFEQTMMQVVFPFLRKIGVLWQTGSVTPAQEHFISNLIRQKLIVAIDGSFVSSKEKHKKYLLYLPEGELHELTLLFCYYAIKSRKNRVIYLGQNVPLADVVSTFNIYQPDYVLTILTTNKSVGKTQKYVNALGDSFKTAQLLLSGYQLLNNDIKLPSNARLLRRLEEFLSMLELQSERSILQE